MPTLNRAIAVNVLRYLTFIGIAKVKYWAEFKTKPIKDEKNECKMRSRWILHKACKFRKVSLPPWEVYPIKNYLFVSYVKVVSKSNL